MFKLRKDRKTVRIPVRYEHCGMVKNMEVLLERPNTKSTKYWFCDNCTYWFMFLNINMKVIDFVTNPTKDCVP